METGESSAAVARRFLFSSALAGVALVEGRRHDNSRCRPPGDA